jgi:hypothetical protein
MRSTRIAAAIVVFSMSGPAFAQEWTEFVSKDDRFTTNFPGVPQVRESTFTSQFGADLPSRVYSATRGASGFSVTVVDYRPVEKILTEKSKSCPAGEGRVWDWARDLPRRRQPRELHRRRILEG